MQKTIFTFALMLLVASTSVAQDEPLRLRDLCRLKGQENNTLHGFGLVVGLKGTGDDGQLPTVRALARMMQLMGAPIGTDNTGNAAVKELDGAKNVAAVMVTVNLPPAGVQQGDRLNCTVNAISAKSLEGGTLMLSPLLGPNADQRNIYALAQGQLLIPDPKIPTSATIYAGCKMETSIRNEFVSGDQLTLIVDKDHSSFSTAQYIEDIINQLNRDGLSGFGANATPNATEIRPLAQAIDQVHIQVTIPPFYRERPVQFVSLLMDLPITNLRSTKRVLINEREQVVIIGENVTFAPVAISQGNLTIEPRAVDTLGSFVGMDVENGTQVRPKLKSLVDALNTLDVPTSEMIAIIKSLKMQGDLYGELIIE